jgi:hypothetical protein
MADINRPLDAGVEITLQKDEDSEDFRYRRGSTESYEKNADSRAREVTELVGAFAKEMSRTGSQTLLLVKTPLGEGGMWTSNVVAGFDPEDQLMLTAFNSIRLILGHSEVTSVEEIHKLFGENND